VGTSIQEAALQEVPQEQWVLAVPLMLAAEQELTMQVPTKQVQAALPVARDPAACMRAVGAVLFTLEVAVLLQVVELVLESLTQRILDAELAPELLTPAAVSVALRLHVEELAVLALREPAQPSQTPIGHMSVREEEIMHSHHRTPMLVRVQALFQKKQS